MPLIVIVTSSINEEPTFCDRHYLNTLYVYSTEDSQQPYEVDHFIQETELQRGCCFPGSHTSPESFQSHCSLLTCIQPSISEGLKNGVIWAGTLLPIFAILYYSLNLKDP